jgi:hypothetical protein
VETPGFLPISRRSSVATASGVAVVAVVMMMMAVG